MEYWRRCCGLTRMDRVPNKEIRRTMNIQSDIVKCIEDKRLLWYSYVRRAVNQ